MQLPFRALVLALLLPLPLTAAPQAAGEATFHRAYYLEHEEGELQTALELYRQVASSAGASAELRERARTHAAALGEELLASDFAAILPAGAIVYLELNRPGDQLSSLLEQLGLLGTVHDALERQSLAISPELVDGMLGIRGAALAVTGVSVTGGGMPTGVAVLHPGDLGVVRGMIETVVPMGGQASDPIHGHPTYLLEGQAVVTFTHRLIVVGSSRGEVEACVRRIEGDASDSLAQDPHMREHLALRGSDLMFLCMNAAPVRPLLSGLLASGAGPQELAMANALLDLDSLEALVMRAGVEQDGMSLDLTVRLEDDHRNLAFNFLRGAQLDGRTLDTVPAGAAGFLASALNPAGPAVASLESDPNGEPVVTAMDLGRELFTNAVGLTLFALPDAGVGPIPGIGLAISSNDAARSQAVFGLLLSVAQVVGGGAELEPETQRVAGRKADVYRLPEGVPVYQVATESTIYLSPSQRVIEHTLTALSEGRTVRTDAVFARHVERFGQGVDFALAAHGGRMLQLARPYMPQASGGHAEGQEALAHVAQALERTTVSVVSRHSASELGMSLALTGVPKVDGLLSQWVARMKAGEVSARVASAPATEAPAPERSKARAARKRELVLQRFDKAVQRADVAAAAAMESDLLAAFGEDARGLNNFAWALLTDDRFGGRFDALALVLSRASNRLDGHSSWQYLDTLALAEFRNGDREAAVKYQEMALGLVDDHDLREDLTKTLERYRRQLAKVE